MTRQYGLGPTESGSIAGVDRSGFTPLLKFSSLARPRFSFVNVFVVAVVLAVVGLCVPRPTLAQTVTANLSGIVTDDSGSAVPGAKVVLTDQATKVTHTTTTNKDGSFSYTAINPSTYTVTITAKGFQTWVESGIALNASESRSVPGIKLKLGSMSQTVTVSAESLPVPVTTGASATTLNNTMVSQLAVQGRDAAELIKLMPGMAINSGLSNSEWSSALTQINTGPIGAFASNGTQPNGSMQLIMNGSVITDAGNQGTQIANINQDMTQEVTIQDSAFDASHAHGPVTFAAVGKSGTSAFHGEAYTYTRNGSLNAEEAFLKASGEPKPIDHYWYPGGNLGGPVVIPGTGFNKSHKRAFFFVGFERLQQQPAGTLHKYFVPTPAMINGSFSQSTMGPYTGFYGSGAIPCAAADAWNFGNFCGEKTVNGSLVPGSGAIDTGQITMYDPSGNAISPSTYDTYQQNLAAYNTCKSANGTNCVQPTVPNAAGSTINSGIDPNGQILMNLLAGAPGLQPLDPTNPNAKGFNAAFLDRPPVNSNELNIRGDLDITNNMKAFVSFTRQTESDINSLGLWWWAGDAVPYPSQTPAAQLSREWSIGVTNTISPTMVNEATFGYAYFINPVTLANPKAADPGTYGYNVQTPFAQPVPQIPDIVSWCCAPGGGNTPNAASAAGFNASSFGSSPNWYGKASGKDSYTPDFSDNFTLVKGTHTFKTGVFWAGYANVQTEGACCGGGTVGQWEFDPWASNSTNNLYADMLLGHAAGFSMASTNFTDNVKYNELDFYVQDAWQIRPRLTLNYGVRFNREGQWYPGNENQGIMVWNPNNSVQPYSSTSTAQWPGFVWHGIDSSIPVSGWPTHSFYPDPRVGVAYDLFGNGRTVLRGGFGLYRFNVAYNDVTANGMLDAPLGLKSFSSNCTFTQLSDLSTCSAAAAGARTSLNQGGMMYGDNSAPYSQTWDIIIDQRAPWNSTFEVQYKGNRSRDLLLSSNGNGGIPINNINYIPIGGLFQADPNPNSQYFGITYYCQQPAGTPNCDANAPPSGAIPDFRPYGYNAINVARHGSYSNYNGMVLQWIKQSGPLVVNMNYTWSHALGIRDGNNDNGQGAGASLDAFCLRCNYGTLAFNRTQIFNAAYVIQLPSPAHTNAFLEQAVNGWQLSGITQWQSGVPLQPLTNGNLFAGLPSATTNESLLGTDGIKLMPYLTCDPSKHLAPGQYFNPNCFEAPNVRGQNGPLVWPNITAPGFFDSDLGVYKNFQITERQKLQFRFTAFNFLNHPNPQFNLTGDVNLNFNTPGGTYTPCVYTGDKKTYPNCTDGYPHFEVGNRTLEFALKYMF